MNTAFNAAVPRGGPLSDDEALEREIETAHRAYQSSLAAGDGAATLDFFNVLASLVNQRSSGQVERMERAKGLR